MSFVDLAAKFKATVVVAKGKVTVDGKSPMEMMLLDAPKGSKLLVTATGDDADEAVTALGQLIADGFGEK